MEKLLDSLTINWKILNMTLEGDNEFLKKVLKKLKVLDFLGIIFNLKYEFVNDNVLSLNIKVWKPFKKIVYKTIIGMQTYKEV